MSDSNGPPLREKITQCQHNEVRSSEELDKL